MLSIVILVALAALARWTSLTMASQGRLIFPTIGAVSTLIAVGVLTLVGAVSARASRFAAFAIGGGLGVLAIVSPFAFILPAYAPPPRVAGEQANIRAGESFIFADQLKQGRDAIARSGNNRHRLSAGEVAIQDLISEVEPAGDDHRDDQGEDRVGERPGHRIALRPSSQGGKP